MTIWEFSHAWAGWVAANNPDSIEQAEPTDDEIAAAEALAARAA